MTGNGVETGRLLHTPGQHASGEPLRRRWLYTREPEAEDTVRTPRGSSRDCELVGAQQLNGTKVQVKPQSGNLCTGRHASAKRQHLEVAVLTGRTRSSRCTSCRCRPATAYTPRRRNTSAAADPH